MPIDLIATAFDQILELAKEKGKRSEKILKALNAIGLKQDAPLDKGFDGVYAYTLVVYGIDKPKPILEFFRHEFIKSAFRKSFEQRDLSILEKETENFLDWNDIGKEILAIDYDPKQEFVDFSEQFILAAKLTRTVQEVLVDQKLDDFSDKLTELPTKDYIDSKFEPIYKKLNGQANSESAIQESESTVEFSIPSTLFFVGQDEALGNLTKGVLSSNVIMIGGMAGIGKTYLVAHFVEIQTDTKPVLWQDCSTFSQLEQVLLSISEFFKAHFDDTELWQLLRNPLANEQYKLGAAAKAIDKYHCYLVWDNFDAKANQSLLPLLLTLNKMLRQGKLVITTREFFEINGAFNPIFRYVIPPMSQEVGLDFMRAYLNTLGLPNEPDELLIEAYKRVGGHPYFMSRLIILSVTLPIRELITSLPQIKDEAHQYIQEQVSSQLDADARKLLQYLSVIRKPFLLSAIDHVVENATTEFDQLTKRFLITKIRKSSSHFEIHDLVKEFESSHLTSDDFIAAHANAAKYYASLETRTYSDGVELLGHLVEAKNHNLARSTLNALLGSAMHDGLFDFVVDLTNQLIEDDATKGWAEIYFFRGRTFRLKGNLDNSLKNYHIASDLTQDKFLKESAQLEISSVMIQSDEKKNLPEALKILNGLAGSENAKTKIQALTSLGYIDIRNKKTLKNGIEKLKEALKLAEEENLHRNIMQICHGLGEAYLKRNQVKNALIYLERARSMREAVRVEYGEQDMEGDNHLFYLLEDAYHRSGRYEDAIKAISYCVFIDRKLNFQDKLASSLFQLGVNLCLARRYEEAEQNLSESLRLINSRNLGAEAESSTIEWLTVATWYLNQFERAVELILEYISKHGKGKGFTGKHIVIQESDLTIQNPADRPEFTKINEDMLHLLVLPKEFTLHDVKQWNENVVKRRPDLAKAYNPVLLYNKLQE